MEIVSYERNNDEDFFKERQEELETKKVSTLSKRVITIITQMIYCSETDIDLKTFCRLIIDGDKFDKDNGFYSLEFHKMNENIHWIHYPFGIPASKKKNMRRKQNNLKNRGKSPQRNFHNQCSFYLAMPEGYFVHAMLFPNFKIKLACCKNRDRDHKIVADRFIGVLNEIMNDRQKFWEGAKRNYVYLKNVVTNDIEKIELIEDPKKIGLSHVSTEMCNETFQANYEIDLDELCHLFLKKYNVCAIQKDDYSGIIIPLLNPDTQNTVHIFVFSSGKMIANSKYEKDSDYAYQKMLEVIITDRDIIEEKKVFID